MNTINDPSADDATRLSTRPHPGDGTERADTDLGDATRLSEHGHPDNPDATVLSAKNRSAGSGRGKSRKTGKTGKKSRTNREFAMPALPERPDDEKTAGESAETAEQADATVVRTPHTHPQTTDADDGSPSAGTDGAGTDTDSEGGTGPENDTRPEDDTHPEDDVDPGNDTGPTTDTDAGDATDSDGDAYTDRAAGRTGGRESEPPTEPELPAKPELPDRDGTTVQRRGSVRRMRNTDVPVTPARGSVTGMIPRPDDDIDYFRRAFAGVEQNVSRVVVGKAMPIRQCITALIAGGHMLLEDNPGTGKTQLARALANSIAASFKRIQFTPDLLPSDVIGVTFYDQKTGEFEFREGPVFASIVLADEINRASPKTQSALLEVMEEQRVTVDGVTHDVPQPFIVIATQNPIEQLGTYRLPEAQMDRFMFKLIVPNPSLDELMSIVNMTQKTMAEVAEAACSGEELLEMRRTANQIPVAEEVMRYAMKLCSATHPDSEYASAAAKKYIRLGASPRAGQALISAAKVMALIKGRLNVAYADINELAYPVLRHRIKLNFEAIAERVSPDEIIGQIVEEVSKKYQGKN